MCRCCLFVCVYVSVWRKSKTNTEPTPKLAIQAAAGALAVRTAIRTQPALGAEGARILLAGATLRPPQHVQMVRIPGGVRVVHHRRERVVEPGPFELLRALA